MTGKAAFAIATWFGAGYFPAGPGTFASLIAIALAWLILETFHVPVFVLGIIAVGLAVPGVWASSIVAVKSGRKDPGLVVVDEVIGQWITLAGIPAFNWRSVLLAFFFFRLFDIWKPFPARRLEALPGGYGIVADDVMAGIYGALAVLIAAYFQLI